MSVPFNECIQEQNVQHIGKASKEACMPHVQSCEDTTLDS